MRDDLLSQLVELGDARGASKLRARVATELAALDGAGTSGASRRQGASNNLSGFAAELQVWKWAPSPVALQRYVQTSDATQGAIVDVVAADGLWWLEVKAAAPFGTNSGSWVALRTQVLRLKACAACHLVGCRRPVVLVCFTLGCSDEVAQVLRALGVAVVQPESGGNLPPSLPLAASLRLPLPPQTRPAQLDLSTLLALISSSVHLPPDDSRLQSWAATNEHWARSLKEEAPRTTWPKCGCLLHVLLVNCAQLLMYRVKRVPC